MNPTLEQLTEELAALDLSAKQVRTLLAGLTCSSIAEICHQANVSTSTYYRWRTESEAFRRGSDLVRRKFFAIVLAEAKAMWRQELSSSLRRGAVRSAEPPR